MGWCERRSPRAGLLGAGVAMLLAAAAAGPASAANLFTLDTHVQSFAPVVVDSAVNGYVTWLHEGSARAEIMFCKLPPGATGCPHPVTLPAPGRGATDEPSQPFPVVASDFVYVIAPRYIDNDTLIYRSSDGGKTFSRYRVPVESYSGKTGPDDVVPTYTNGALYRGGPTSMSGQIYFEVSASNPGLGFSFSTWGMTFPQDVGVPGFGSSQLSFSNVGPGLVGGSTLGVSAGGDMVEAYWLESTPPVVAYYSWSAARGLPSAPEQVGWIGPSTVSANGYLPRLASGPAGLFLLSAEGTSPTADPARLELRKYAPATHSFPTRITLATLTADQTSFSDGGGLDENRSTGQLAAVWPLFGSARAMSLYVSSDGGATFSGGQEIATIRDGYASADNARVAVDDGGAGFLTFVDSGGIEVADLNPLAAQYKLLASRRGDVLVPVTCTAPKGRCTALVTVIEGGRKAAAQSAGAHAGGILLASGRFTVPAGTTKNLEVRLTLLGQRALASHHRGLRATLTIVIHLGARAHTTTASATVKG